MSEFLEKNPWNALRQFTNARIALGRAGNSLPTVPLLAFNLSHAQARDAVHHPLDTDVLHEQLRAQNFSTLDVHSAAPDREHYLRRPDLGRRLSDESRTALVQLNAESSDVVFVIADGLSAFAHRNSRFRCCRPSVQSWLTGRSAPSWSRVRLASRLVMKLANCSIPDWL